MNVQRICFLGTRTGNFEETAALFRDVLGLGNVHAEPGRSFFQPVSTASRSIEEALGVGQRLGEPTPGFRDDHRVGVQVIRQGDHRL